MQTKGLAYLSLLVFQTSIHSLVLRYSRTKPGPSYDVSLAVTVSEIFKMLFCIGILLYKRELYSFIQSVIQNPIDSLKTCSIALLYFIQNNLMIYALSNLDAVVFQLLYQIKILTTALFSWKLLGKEISTRQWTSLVLLFFGVSIVALSDSKLSSSSFGVDPNKNVMIGCICVFLCSVLSGFSAVAFELLLKNSKRDLWNRNLELSTTSVIIGILTNLGKVFNPNKYEGFDSVVLLVILLQSLGGLLVALVVKHTDNIKKVFACAIAIVVTSVISVYLFDFRITLAFIAGSILVKCSLFMYTHNPPTIIPEKVKL